MAKKKLAVFISGYGSNLNIFLQNKSQFSDLLVVSSNPEAYGLQRAKASEVDSLVFPKPVDWGGLQKALETRGIELVFLAGFMVILPPTFVQRWQGRLFNLHPSLLPKYKGLHSIKRAYEAGDEIGVTIHEVTAEVDSGRIVAQKIAVTREETTQIGLEEAIARTHSCEHQLVQSWIDMV